MSESKAIKEGDWVEVWFFGTGDEFIAGEVLHMPVASGDAWHIRLKNGRLVYVQHYECIYGPAVLEEQEDDEWMNAPLGKFEKEQNHE